MYGFKISLKGLPVFLKRKKPQTLYYKAYSFLIIMPQTGIEPVRVSLPTGF